MVLFGGMIGWLFISMSFRDHEKNYNEIDKILDLKAATNGISWET